MFADLPINEIKTEFLSAIDSNNLVVLSAPPGAGKSTGLPLWLVGLSQYNKVYLLQPRRMAAKSIACFLAQQLGEPIGQTIGYRLRNESKVSANTKIEVITEGILTQIIQHDPELTGCDLILFDEFHERSVHADFAFALAREVQTSLRDDLTLVLMSATLSIDFLTSALPEAHFIASQGRSFPVEISYQPIKSTITTQTFSKPYLWREHALSVIKHTLKSHQGSILVFLPGSADIKYLAEQLVGDLPPHFQLSPLFGDLSLSEQQRAIEAPKVGFKLVLATNIAETSLTIDGINMVIDSGLEKLAVYDSQTLTNKLHQQPIAKASATQRSGRAGRLMPGHCIRLYNQEEFERRAAHQVSEIRHTDLQPLLIEAARWGVSALSQLPLLERPKLILEDEAWSSLIDLNIVDQKRKLSVHGNKVAVFPCHPRYAHMIIGACDLSEQHKIVKLPYLACIMAAMLEERDVFSREQGQANVDLSARVRFIMSKPNIGRHQAILKQAKQLITKCHLSDKSLTKIAGQDLPLEYCGELLALAYPERIAKLKNQHGEYLTSNGKGINCHLDDPLASHAFIVAGVTTQYRQKLFVRIAAPVDINRLQDWGIVKVSTNSITEYNEQSDKIVAEQQTRLGAIVLTRTAATNQLESEQLAAMWCSQLTKRGLKFLSFSSKVECLLTRLRWLNQHQAQLLLPDFSEQGLLASLESWFSPFVGDSYKKSQLLALDYQNMLLSLLDYEQQKRIKSAAPTAFIGPTGRHCGIRYDENKSPTVAMPMQELYGHSQTPTVGEQSNIPLTLELLSPAGRPIQVTQDLSAFWQGSYKEVQKEMKGKYPKHYWPDDPANAQATNKTKRHLKL